MQCAEVKRKAWTEREHHLLATLAKQGLTLKELADRLGRSYEAVKKRRQTPCVRDLIALLPDPTIDRGTRGAASNQPSWQEQILNIKDVKTLERLLGCPTS